MPLSANGLFSSMFPPFVILSSPDKELGDWKTGFWLHLDFYAVEKVFVEGWAGSPVFQYTILSAGLLSPFFWHRKRKPETLWGQVVLRMMENHDGHFVFSPSSFSAVTLLFFIKSPGSPLNTGLTVDLTHIPAPKIVKIQFPSSYSWKWIWRSRTLLNCTAPSERYKSGLVSFYL